MSKLYGFLLTLLLGITLKSDCMQAPYVKQEKKTIAFKDSPIFIFWLLKEFRTNYLYTIQNPELNLKKAENLNENHKVFIGYQLINNGSNPIHVNYIALPDNLNLDDQPIIKIEIINDELQRSPKTNTVLRYRHDGYESLKVYGFHHQTYIELCATSKDPKKVELLTKIYQHLKLKEKITLTLHELELLEGFPNNLKTAIQKIVDSNPT